MPSWAHADTTQVWFDPPSTRFFYWLIPESPARAAVGLIADDPEQARTSLQHFLAAQHLEALNYQGAQVPSYRGNGLPAMAVSGARVFLIGDAAAQVKMTTVGGAVNAGGSALDDAGRSAAASVASASGPAQAAVPGCQALHSARWRCGRMNTLLYGCASFSSAVHVLMV
jgi:flavin-dependent dehydrogenase